MNFKRLFPFTFFLLILCMLGKPAIAFQSSTLPAPHVWEMQEITLKAENTYDNYYKDITVWVDLQGPDFTKRVYGFWDGDNVFKVRFVATKAGQWQWTSGSNQEGDQGLNNKSGSFSASDWTEEEKAANPNRRGFVRATPNGHALQYADGSPFFMVGDTWLAGSTWRLPFRNAPTSRRTVSNKGTNPFSDMYCIFLSRP